jgi:hypothetical protein
MMKAAANYFIVSQIISLLKFATSRIHELSEKW